MSAHPIPPLRDREPPREPIPFPRGRRATWQRVLLWTGGTILALVIVVVLGIVILLHNARFHQYVLNTAQQKVSASLGSQVVARSYTLTWSGISPTVDLYDISIAGAPPYPDPPLLTADHIHVAVRVTSLLRHSFYIDDIVVDHPVVHALFDQHGGNNLPKPKQQSQGGSTDVFSLGIRHAMLNNGEVYYNDRKTPLQADLHDLTVQAGFDPAQTRYAGSLSYHDGHIVMGDYRPIPHEMDAQFTYTRQAFTLESARLRSGNSLLALHAVVSDLATMKLDGNYSAVLDTGEFRRLLKNPALPAGVLRTSGTLHYASVPNKPAIDMVKLNGQLTSDVLRVQTPSFEGDVRNLGAQYAVAGGNADVRDLHMALLGGTLTGDLAMRDLAGNTHSTLHAVLHQLSLASLKSMMASPQMKNVDLRGTINATAEATWGKTMNDLAGRADAKVDAALGQPNGGRPVPMAGVIHARYAATRQELTLSQSYLRTPQTSLTLDGAVGDHSALQVNLQARDLREVQAVANALKPPESDQAPLNLSGSASFVGAVRGTPRAPQIDGQLSAANLTIRGSRWRLVRAHLSAGPQQLRIQNGELDPADRGRITLDLTAGLSHWSFTDQSPFTARVEANQLNVADFAALTGKGGQLSGTANLHANVRGTERAPFGNGTVSLAGAKMSGYDIPGLHGDFQATGDRLHATLRADIPRATAEAVIDYLPRPQDFKAQLRITGLRLEDQQIVKAKAPDLTGVLSLTANGSGNIHNPTVQANLTIPRLAMRGQNVSNVDLQATVANQVANFTLGSNVVDTSLVGRGRVELTGLYNADVTLDTRAIPLEPLVAMYMPTQAGNVTGRTELHAVVRGPLKNKAALDAHLTIPVLQVAYKNAVQIGAANAIRIDYTNGTAVLQPVHIIGTGTDLQARGEVPVQGKGPMSLMLLGTVDLKLAQMISPDASSSGQLKFDINSYGQRANPDVQGRIEVINASFATGDVPLGLQNGNGVLTLTRDRLDITQFKGLVGGGPVTATGGVQYRPSLNFMLGLHGQDIRLLYQDAVRAGLNADLVLTGTPQDAMLRGNVDVVQLQFTPDFDLMNFAGSLGGGDATPPPSDSFANNLKLNVNVGSGGGVHLVSRTMSLQGAANLHVVGNGTQPVILGRVNLNGGDLIFMGNRYKLEGGTIDFVDPNQTKPVVDASVTTTVQQYDIQMHFWGPADHLHTNYASDPALPPSDIINLIAFGKTTEASAANPTPPGALGAESLVASQVSSQITSRVEKFAGISQLSIDPVLGGNNQNPGAHIAIQQRVTSKIFVTFSTDVTATQNQVIKFEYQLNPRVSLSATRDQNGGFAIDSKIHRKW